MSIMKHLSACFSGPRPEKLLQHWDEQHPEVIRIKQELQAKTVNAAIDGYRIFLSGMARGVDLLAAETVLNLKQVLSDLYFVAVIPYRGQRFSDPEWANRYNRALENADQVIILSEQYYNGCFMERNRYMVEQSGRLIAVVNGTKGGTAATLRYAEKQGLEIDLIATALRGL